MLHTDKASTPCSLVTVWFRVYKRGVQHMLRCCRVGGVAIKESGYEVSASFGALHAEHCAVSTAALGLTSLLLLGLGRTSTLDQTCNVAVDSVNLVTPWALPTSSKVTDRCSQPAMWCRSSVMTTAPWYVCSNIL
jgi:hypothetical protein